MFEMLNGQPDDVVERLGAADDDSPVAASAFTYEVLPWDESEYIDAVLAIWEDMSDQLTEDAPELETLRKDYLDEIMWRKEATHFSSAAARRQLQIASYAQFAQADEHDPDLLLSATDD